MNTFQKVNNSELKIKVLKIKDWLPASYTDKVVDRLPHLAIFKARIYNVVRLVTVDPEIIDVLEQIAIENGMPVDSLRA